MPRDYLQQKAAGIWRVLACFIPNQACSEPSCQKGCCLSLGHGAVSLYSARFKMSVLGLQQ